MSINLPKEAKQIIDKLYDNGFEAFVVGGCVRDSLLGKIPNDWDITTNAAPEDIMNIFKHTVPTGLKYGTVTVIINKKTFEVTTYRIEGKYSDNRRPDNVKFTDDIVLDLSRRDFTINAMAYNYKIGLLDEFSGKEDMQNKVIRCVGKADKRFSEDALRMMRAFRFVAQLSSQKRIDWKFSADTKAAVIKNSHLIRNVSIERIKIELDKVLLSNNPQIICDIVSCGLMQYIIPELTTCAGFKQNNPHHVYDVLSHSVNAVKTVEKDLILRLTLLFHDIGKIDCKTTDECGIDHFHKHAVVSYNKAKTILKRLKYDNKTINTILPLIYYHDVELPVTKKGVKRWLNKLGTANFVRLLEIKDADAQAQNPEFYEPKYKVLQEIQQVFNSVIENNECFSKKDLYISGNDIINLGVKPGRQIGIIIEDLLHKVIDNPKLNTKEKLIEIVKNKYL